jgi:hypothetical protein
LTGRGGAERIGDVADHRVTVRLSQQLVDVEGVGAGLAGVDPPGFSFLAEQAPPDGDGNGTGRMVRFPDRRSAR